MHDLLSALCLVAVLEGLFLFAAPQLWRKLVEQVMSMHSFQVRFCGMVTLVIGLAALWLVRH